MAGRMLETMAGELWKEVVRIKAIDRLSKLKVARAAAQAEGGKGGIQIGGAEKAKLKPKSFMEEDDDQDGSLSDSTVCLLIDRFVPC